RGAVRTLTDVMWHEMVIAALAILLILSHVRSAFVICVTLPLSVLFSFALMWVLRRLGVVDVQANIMSLAGITISVGVLVDQAIVMVENATHHLRQKFPDGRVTGDTRDVVIPALRTVGRPIFFSVMIMLLSFVPVFMLSGREGKLFHPLALTKSFALLGTALISVTVVPALIPGFVRGRLRGEHENWIVRGFTRVYRPMLNFALDRFNVVMWAFAAVLILAAGLFPLQAVLGLGVTQAADDLKARDALLRGFPEVEGVVGKAGRAETATDPAPLDMVETFVNFRPRDLWPRRVIRYPDAERQTRRILAALEQRGYLATATGDDRDTLVNDAAQKALERFDEVM